jgi:hypothetical protein
MSPTPLPAPGAPFSISHFAFPISHSALRISKKAFALTILAAFLCATPSHACTIFVAGGDWGEPPVHDSKGAPLAIGHKASLGTFADGFDLQANSSNLTAILANWREFASSATSPEGSFTIFADVPDGIVGGFAFPGKKIYLLLTRTSSPGNEALPDGSNVRDYAIFTSNSTVNPWVFPNSADAADADGSNLAQIGTGQIDYAIAGTIDPSAGILLAQYSSDPADPTAPTAFQQWLAIAFPGQQVAPEDIVEPLGIPVLAAFALGTPASSDSPAPAPYTTVQDPENPGRVGIEFTRRTASSSGFLTFAEASADLSDWSLPVAHEVTPATESTETVRAFPDYTQAPEGTDTSKAFFRIRVEPANQN